MSLSVKECTSTYTELLQVQGHCPERPYVELMVPSDARKILSIIFTIVSRDQGNYTAPLIQLELKREANYCTMRT